MVGFLAAAPRFTRTRDGLGDMALPSAACCSEAGLALQVKQARAAFRVAVFSPQSRSHGLAWSVPCLLLLFHFQVVNKFFIYSE